MNNPTAIDHAGHLVTNPRRPPSWKGWKRQPAPPGLPLQDGGEIWRLRGRVLAISSLIYAEFRDGMHWQYLVSISYAGGRASDFVCRRVLADFGIPTAEEDNHESGVARKFWRLIDIAPDEPQLCECKETEETIVEPDGYTYTRERL